MDNTFDLKSLEKKAYRSTFQDGILDIFFGLLIYGAAFRSWIGESWASFVLPGIAIAFFTLGKKYVTVPRIGVVKFGPARKKRRTKLFIIMIGFQVLTMGIWVASSFGFFETFLGGILDGFGGRVLIEIIILVMPLTILAYLLDFPRLYYIAVIAGFTWPVSEILLPRLGEPMHEIVVYLTAGTIIIIPGIVNFMKFLQKYSPVEADLTAGTAHE